MHCVSGCLPSKCTCNGPMNCVIRIRSLYRGGFEFKINTETTGQECIRKALQCMAIPDEGASFFGLQHELFGEKCWIKNDTSIYSQLSAAASPCKRPNDKRLFVILLRIRFYGVPDSLLDDETFRNFLFHQLKTDFLDGKLTRCSSEVVSLSAYLLHLGSLTLISHAMPGIDFERKLVTAIPKQICSVKLLAPYVRSSMKIIASLTSEQTKMRFVSQCQLLPRYGTEKYAATLLPSQTPTMVCFSCNGIILGSCRRLSKLITDWDNLVVARTQNEVLIIEFLSKMRRHRHRLVLLFSTPERAQRASCACSLQQKLAQRWKRPSLLFQPLVHVPKSLLLFDGESAKLSEAIMFLFSSSYEDLHGSSMSFKRESKHQRAGCYSSTAFMSEMNIHSRADSCFTSPELDAFSLPSSSEESTLPLIYGSLLAQSTPVLRQHSSVRGISRANCMSAQNLPHKKRLAASRPFISNVGGMMDQSVTGLFSSQQSIDHSEWTVTSMQTLAMSHPHLSRHSEVEMEEAVEEDQPNILSSHEAIYESSRSPSQALSRSVSSRIPSEAPEYQRISCSMKFKSECVLDKNNSNEADNHLISNCDLTESSDDLTALPSKSNYSQARTLPANFKRRTVHSGRLMCLELIEKIHDGHELELEYRNLPVLKDICHEGTTTVDLGLPVRFLVSPNISKNYFKSEDFWTNVSHILVLLDAPFLLDQCSNSATDVWSMFHTDLVAGDHVPIGKDVFLSLFSVNRSQHCHTFGIHVKFAATSPHHLNNKTAWLFCWTGDVSSQVVSPFGSFVDEVVATDLSSSTTSPSSTITVASMNNSRHSCSLYVVAHILLRTYRHPSPLAQNTSTRSIFSTVSAVRGHLPCTVVSLEEYKFLYELLLRWLEKPPRLI